MTTEIKIFATHNSTDKWAVIVDQQLGLYDTQAEAEAVYRTIGGEDGTDGLSGTPFGSCQMLPPHYRSLVSQHEAHSDIADFIGQASDLAQYIAAAKSRVPTETDRPVYDMDDTLGLFSS